MNDAYSFTTMDDSGFYFEEDLVFSGEIKPFEEQFLKIIEGGKQTDEECSSEIETKNQQIANNEPSSSFDESKFELSASEFSLNVLNDSGKVLNSTCYKEDEGSINNFLQSLLDKVDAQNSLTEINEKSASEKSIEKVVSEAEVSDLDFDENSKEKMSELFDASLKSNAFEQTSFEPGTFDNLMDASLSTVGATYASSVISDTDFGENSAAKMVEEVHQQTMECSSVANCDLSNISHKTSMKHSNALAGAIDNLMDASLPTAVGTTFFDPVITSTDFGEKSTTKVADEVHQQTKEYSLTEKCELINISHTNVNDSSALPGAIDNLMDASLPTVETTLVDPVITSTDIGENSATKMVEEVHQQTMECSSVDNCDLINISHKTSMKHSNALAGAIDNLMDASLPTAVETTFVGPVISDTDFEEKSTTKVADEVHQQAKEYSLTEKCELINISHTTNVNDSSALPGAIDNLMDVSLSTFESQMSHFSPLSNGGCMITGVNQPSVPMEEENLIEVSISSKNTVDEIVSKSELEEIPVDSQQEKVDSTNTDNPICEQLVKASTVVTLLQALSKPVEEQDNLLDISLPNLETKIGFMNSVSNVSCISILEDEMPEEIENLLSNSDSDSEIDSTNLKTSEKKTAPVNQSGTKREAPSDLKYSESKLKKPRTLLPVPTSIARLRSPLAAVNRSVNLISNTKLTESTSKKLFFDDESIKKSVSKIPSMLSKKNENLCHSQLSHIRKPSSVNSAKVKAQTDKTGIPMSRQIPTNLPVPKSKLNFAANSAIPSLPRKTLPIPIGENRGNANKAVTSRLPKLQRW